LIVIEFDLGRTEPRKEISRLFLDFGPTLVEFVFLRERIGLLFGFGSLFIETVILRERIGLRLRLCGEN